MIPAVLAGLMVLIAGTACGVEKGGAAEKGRAPDKPAAYLVPAHDHALAEVLLAAEGLTRPVLLFDPRDRIALDAYLAKRKAATRCFLRAVERPEVAQPLAALAAEPCVSVASAADLSVQLWSTPAAVIVTSESDGEWLLRAAAFSAATRAALLPLGAGATFETSRLVAHGTRVYLTPPALGQEAKFLAAGAKVVKIGDPQELVREQLRIAGETPRSVVVANPNDTRGHFSPSALSLLAPLVAAAQRAPLVLSTQRSAGEVERDVLNFIDGLALTPSHVVLVGDELALRSHVVPDPVASAGGPAARGGGTEVRVELFSRIEREEPQDFSVGRIVAEDVATASVNFARRLHSSKKRRSAAPVVFLANADEIFPLGETISRTTVAELRNLSVPVRAYYRGEVTPEVIRKSLTDTELLVWEGHSRDLTLEQLGGVSASAAPDFVLLQGCYTLDRSDPFILMEKGTHAIVASSAAIYSAPGSAFARALFDSLLYDGADLGTAVRNARNYLLALARLQRERGHTEWTKTYRAALAFALWGDPTWRPALTKDAPLLEPARWKATAEALSLTIPRHTLAAVTAGEYRAAPVPRAMLGGLVLRNEEHSARELKAMHYTVQHAAAVNVCPPGPGWNVVSLHAPRTNTLTVLARPDWDVIGGKKHGRFEFPLVEAACP